jgi:hypothetical protein
VNCHSNGGFQRADSNGVRLLGEAIDIEAGTYHFHLAGHSEKFCKWINSAYSRPCGCLPNLFFLDNEHLPWRPLYDGGTLRIGAFGQLGGKISGVPREPPWRFRGAIDQS